MRHIRQKDEALEVIKSDGVTYNLKVAAWETAGKYEVWEMVWDKGTDVGYHEHHKSYETFFITKGSIEVMLARKKFIAKAGDIVQVPPYLPHAMVFLEDTTMIAYFYNYKFYNAMQERLLLKEQNPDILNDADFDKEFGIRHDSHSVKTPTEVLQETQK